MLSVSLVRQERRAIGGRRAGADAGGAHRTPPWDRRARRTSPRGGPSSGGASACGRRPTGVRRVTCPGWRGPRRWGAPRADVGRVGRAGAEVGENLVDHRRLGDARDDPHGPATRRTRERVDLEDLRQERRPPAGGLGRRASWRGDEGGGPSAGAGAAFRRVPRGRLAYQPSYRVVTWPVYIRTTQTHISRSCRWLPLVVVLCVTTASLTAQSPPRPEPPLPCRSSRCQPSGPLLVVPTLAQASRARHVRRRTGVCRSYTTFPCPRGSFVRRRNHFEHWCRNAA